VSGERRIESAEALRRAFDGSFADPPAAAARGREGFLTVRIGGDPYAFRVGDVLAVVSDRKIVAVPTPAPALLGLASLRGDLVPVYDLAQLLGQPRATSTRWLAVARGPDPVGFAFETFEAHVSAASDLEVGRPILRLDALLQKRILEP
jgi:chemotaxis signal transduction protein